MESSGKTPEYIEMLKSKLSSLKYPLKHNLNNLNDLLDLFDDATAALLNPIKKLKISYNMRINSFKGKYESVLAGIKSKFASLEKSKNSKNLHSLVYLQETAQQSKEFSDEHTKLMRLLEECLGSISTLNKLFDTEEFQKLEELTFNLRSAKKKSKTLSLNLNEDDDVNLEEIGSSRSGDNAKRGGNDKKVNGKHKAMKINGNGLNKSIEEIDDSKNDENEITKIGASNSFKRTNKSSFIANGNKQSLSNKISAKDKNKDSNKKANSGGISDADENSDNEKSEDANKRKLTDEECLEKMKEIFTQDKGLTKTFITRKLKKRIMINRLLDFNIEESYRNVESTIPKKSGPNSYLKVTMEICDKDEFNLNSSLMFFMKDLFNAYFIVFKDKNKRMKIVIAGHITKDIISFLKKVSTEEFKEKHSVLTMKIKAYAFYEELVNEFHKREGIVAKKINDAEIKDYLDQFNYLNTMRKAYEAIKQMRVDL